MWNQFESGATIGTKGSESGSIIKDEEHDNGARITLESSTRNAPFAITCGIYGWMFHTRFLGNELEALEDYATMQIDLSRILDLIPSAEDLQYDQKRAEVYAALDRFVERFP